MCVKWLVSKLDAELAKDLQKDTWKVYESWRIIKFSNQNLLIGFLLNILQV